MVKKVLAIGLLCASLGLAQRGGNKNGDSGAPIGPPPAANKFENIATTLNLNKDQKKTVRTILDDAAKEAAPLRDQISKSRVAVGDAIGGKKGDEELKQVARTSSDLSAQLTQLELKTFAKIFATLDDTQKSNKQALGRVLGLMTDLYHTKNWNED